MLAKGNAGPSPLSEGCILAGALRCGAERLSRTGIENPRLDAEILLRQALSVTREQLFVNLPQPLSHGAGARYEALLRRREAREPLAYITGGKEFWSLDFMVTPAVLIPRPETELLVELALAEARRKAEGGAVRILDIGTGSGAIAVALARELERAEIWGCDISAAALEVAEQNAIRHGVSRRVRFVESDLFAAFEPTALRFDLIVSNPPYVSRARLAAAEPEIREWEPAVALDGGLNGLAHYPKIVAGARRYLSDPGALFLEIGSDQARAVADIIAGVGGYLPASIHRDHAGRDRVVVARTGGPRG